MFVTIIATWTTWLLHHCGHLCLNKCWNSGRIWGDVCEEVDVEWGRVSKNWSHLSPLWIVKVWVLTYRLRPAKQQWFCFLCPLWKQHSQLESKTLPSVCWVLPRMFWVCLLLSPAFVQSGALPGTLSPPSLLVATGSGLDHPVFHSCCRELPELYLALQCQWML